MSRREDVDNGVWSDPDFAALSPTAKLVYLWTFTNPRCGMAGLYKVTAGAAAFETGLTIEQERQALEELAEARFAFYREGVLFVRARVKHLRTRGPNMVTSILTDVEKIDPAHPLREAFLAEYREDTWLSEHLKAPKRDGLAEMEAEDAVSVDGTGAAVCIPGGAP